MKIPYVVSLNTRAAYSTSSVMKASLGEVARKVVPEDFEWDDEITPAPLTYYAALELSRIFHRIDPLAIILRKDVDLLMDLYPDTIPLKFSVPLIKYERYWQRCFYSKFPERKEMGVKYWKGKYLSTVLQDYLENVNPDVFLEDEAVTLARLVAPYIYFINLSQLQMVRQPTPPIPYPHLVEDECIHSVPKRFDHLPMEPVVQRLFNLQEISLVFGINGLEENYKTRFFEFSMLDVESLCRGMEYLNHLRVFRINRSNLDCSKVKVFLENLVRKESIEELDFNHCKIGDYGMKALGGFIAIHNNLKVVRIANNRFKEVGVQGIAYALQMKPAAPIELIDFSLNPMSLQCATTFAAAFVRCKDKPQTLIINACGFSGPSAEKGVIPIIAMEIVGQTIPVFPSMDLNNGNSGIHPTIFSPLHPAAVRHLFQMAGLLCLNRGLRRLDMCANDFSGEAETTLIRALELNRNILTIDMRRTRISDETQAKVDELLLRNKNLLGTEREPSDEIPPLYLNEPEYLVWEYNPNNPDYIPGRYPERIPEV